MAYASYGNVPNLQPVNVSKMHALVIGINKYRCSNEASSARISSRDPVVNLQGAVSDAQKIGKYLTESLKVPTSHITYLLDEVATRHNIITKLEELASNTTIERDAPILLYFAGHGGSGAPPPNYDNEGVRIQYIIPHDYNMGTIDPDEEIYPTVVGETRKSRNTSEREHVYAISDKQLGSLIHKIAEAHGDNILVILDCCYSGSGTRGTSAVPVGAVARGFDDPLPPPDDWHGNIAVSRGGDITPTTHTFLSACGAWERAWELPSIGGVFTRAIIEVLRKTRSRHHITYAQLLEQTGQRMKSVAQNPQFEGPSRNRLLFQNKESGGHPPLRVLSSDDTGRTVTLCAGPVHGVSPGSEIEIYALDKTDNVSENLRTSEEDNSPTLAAVLTVPDSDNADGLETTLELPESVAFTEGQAFVVCPLRIHIQSHPDLSALREHSQLRARFYMGCTAIAVKLVEDADADLHVSCREGNMTFDISFKIKKRDRQESFGALPRLLAWIVGDSSTIPPTISLPLKLSTTSNPLDIDGMLRIARAAAPYLWHLRRRGTASLFDRNRVDVHVVEVVRDKINGWKFHKSLPMSSNSVNIPVGPKGTSSSYGIKVTSTEMCPLYAAVFLFNSDLAITRCDPWSTAYGGKIPDAPLQAAIEGRPSVATVGYGASLQPLQFSIAPHVEKEICFLKVFISTNPVDLSFMEQPSPSSVSIPKKTGATRRARETGRPKDSIVGTSRGWDGYGEDDTDVQFLWDEMTIPIVLTRSPS